MQNGRQTQPVGLQARETYLAFRKQGYHRENVSIKCRVWYHRYSWAHN